MVFVYILQLENNKYYVGKTNNPTYRLENHFADCGAEWTKKHKPIKILKIIPDCDDYDEDKYTRMCMDEHGINNVRGGSFTSMKFNESTMQVLEMMSRGTNDKCFICGQIGHFAKDCDEESDDEWEDDDNDTDDESIYVFECEKCNKEFDDEDECINHEKYCNASYKSACS